MTTGHGPGPEKGQTSVQQPEWQRVRPMTTQSCMADCWTVVCRQVFAPHGAASEDHTDNALVFDELTFPRTPRQGRAFSWIDDNENLEPLGARKMERYKA